MVLMILVWLNVIVIKQILYHIHLVSINAHFDIINIAPLDFQRSFCFAYNCNFMCTNFAVIRSYFFCEAYKNREAIRIYHK